MPFLLILIRNARHGRAKSTHLNIKDNFLGTYGRAQLSPRNFIFADKLIIGDRRFNDRLICVHNYSLI